MQHKQHLKQLNLASHSFKWLLIMQAFVLIPLLSKLPIWLWLVWLFAVVYRIQVYRETWSLPGRLTRIGLIISCLFGLLWSYGVKLGVEPVVALLVTAFTLKTLELQHQRDGLLLVYTGFIVLAAQFLFSQSLLAASYGLICSTLLIATLYNLQCTEPRKISHSLRYAGIGLLMSIPIMVLLFLLLPKLPPLWSVPNIQRSATTGFSEQLRLGDISNLVKSNEVAFRVSFAGEKPAQKNLYWRGLVLENFNGLEWQQKQIRFSKLDELYNANKPPSWYDQAKWEPDQVIAYRVLLEPHQQPWLFTLMLPIALQDTSAQELYFVDSMLLRTAKPIDQRIIYSVKSALKYNTAAFTEADLNSALKISYNFNPKTLQLGQQLQQRYQQPETIIQEVLNLFNQRFTYTLQPPPLGQDSVDEFLFITQRGFCEHFASSFVLLMRAAGIPARIVVGYQGGEWNAGSKYLLVRQSDAHAWAEVWLEKQGWVRIDPTAAVAPERIEQGLDQALSETERSALFNLHGSSRWLGQLAQRWDALSYHWHRWVLGYDTEQQQRLFRWLLGGNDYWRVGLLFLFSMATTIGLLFLVFLWRHHRRLYSSAAMRSYADFCEQMSNQGYTRYPGESPSLFAQRLARYYPQQAEYFKQVTNLFQYVVYQGQKEKLSELIRELRKLKMVIDEN